MLKLTYTEFGLYLERVTTPLEAFVCQRMVLAIRLGQTLHVEPSRAAFLLSVDLPGLNQLEALARSHADTSLMLAPVDDAFVEVSVQGSWIAASTEAHSGTFVTALTDRAEFFVDRLWQATQQQATLR